MLALKELLHNLKDRDWDVNPIYKIDKNEARRIIEGIEGINKWIPLTKRPMTEEEREYYKEWSDVECGTILDCPLPEDGQEVLVSYGGYVCTDTFCADDGCFFEGVDIDDVQAWMPLPQPYKTESEV